MHHIQRKLEEAVNICNINWDPCCSCRGCHVADNLIFLNSVIRQIKRRQSIRFFWPYRISGLVAETGWLDEVMCTWNLFKLPTIKVWLGWRSRPLCLPAVLRSLSENTASSLIFFFKCIQCCPQQSAPSPESFHHNKLDWNYPCGKSQYVPKLLHSTENVESLILLIIYWIINYCVMF